MDTTRLDVPNTRAITKQLLELSQETANQPFIVQEPGCLQGLVTYSQHSDHDVVVMAVRTMQFLSSHPQNKKPMREFPGLVDKLTSVSLTCTDNRAKDFSAQALINLGVLIRNKDWWADESEEKKENVEANRSFHTIVMQVDGLNEAGTCAIAQRVLVNVKGVISVAIDKARGHVLVGTRADSDDNLVDKLQEALAQAGLNGEPWPPASPALNLSAASAAADDDDESGYLDEKEYEQMGNIGGALARWGHTSLEARLAEEKREEELRQAKAERLLQKVGSALTSAGSWLLGW